MKKKRRKRNEYNIESHLKVELRLRGYIEFILTFTYTLTLMLCISLFIGDIAWCKQIKNRV